MAAPTMTYNTAGNIRANASLAGNANTTSNLIDASTSIEAQVTVRNTPGATVATTRGLLVNFLPVYAAAATNSTLAAFSYTFPSATASTSESKTFFLGTGKWRVYLQNLDTTNAVSVEITADYVTGIA
jgi:hypothetical protein